MSVKNAHSLRSWLIVIPTAIYLLALWCVAVAIGIFPFAAFGYGIFLLLGLA